MAAPALGAVESLSTAEIARLYRERMRDKSYQLLPLGMEAAGYLRWKRKRLSDNSKLAYESTLSKFARTFPDLELRDFEPPVGSERIEEWLDAEWGRHQPATYNRHLAVIRDFFRWAVVVRRTMHGDPTLAIENAKKRERHRETFTLDQRRAIIASQSDLRDRIALRLMLVYGLRIGGLRTVQIKHFDHRRKKLAVFLKGGAVRPLPIPDPDFWHDLERHILDSGAKPNHYLMTARWGNRHTARTNPEQPMGRGGLHRWWYRCLERAEIVDEGTTAGERTHKARHTAGQALLDSTHGNLKAVQKLLMHKSIQTTADVYTDWDDEALAADLARMLSEEEAE